MVPTPALREKIAALIEESEILKTQAKEDDGALRALLTNLSDEEWICVQALTWLGRGHGESTLEASIEEARDDLIKQGRDIAYLLTHISLGYLALGMGRAQL